MFNERARFRLHHPVGPIPDLVAAPDGRPDTTLAERVIHAFRRASSPADAGPVWESLLRENQGDLLSWLQSGDRVHLADDLANLGRSNAAQGFFGGAGQHRKCANDPAFAQLLAAWTYDKLLSLAEAVGSVRLELPETGPWGENLRHSATQLWDAIESRLGIDLSPPQHVGAYLGISVGHQIVQLRVIESIYAAYRLRQITEQKGLRHVCEIGAGAGLTAYYASLFGIREYSIIDLPTMNSVQGYMLGGSKIGHMVNLLGEDGGGKSIHILPPESFRQIAPGSIDILFNQDSLPEIEPAAAIQYMKDSEYLRIPIVLSINQEAHLPTSEGHQKSTSEIISEVPAYRLSSRHRHWLRQGYLEEVFELQGSV